MGRKAKQKETVSEVKEQEAPNLDSEEGDDIEEVADSQADSAPVLDPDEVARLALLGPTEVTQPVVENKDEKPQPTNTTGPEIRDKAGTLFDPNLHARKASGEPSFAANGLFRRKRGTGSNSRIGATTASVSATAQAQQSEEQRKLNAQIAGRGISNIIFTSGQIIGGEEWLPQKDEKTGLDERRDMEMAWSAYALESGMQAPPAWLLVCFVTLSYAAPRFAAPKTQERLGGFGRWIRNVYIRTSDWWQKRRERKNNAARSNNRNDREREIDASQETSKRAA